MEFFKAVEARVSVRAYLPKPVEDKKLEKILQTANLAPSAGNFQSYRIIVVRGKNMREELSAASRNQQCLIETPLCLAFVADGSRNTKYGKRGLEF